MSDGLTKIQLHSDVIDRCHNCGEPRIRETINNTLIFTEWHKAECGLDGVSQVHRI